MRQEVTYPHFFSSRVLNLHGHKNYFSSTAATGNPVGIPFEAMKTMATSTVDCTTSWCPSIPLTISKHSSSLQVSNVSKFDACSINCPSSSNLTGLREIPTRISLRDPTDAIVDPLDDGDVACNQTTTLPPTSSVGNAAPLPYQLELAAITAAIERMQQHNEASMHQDRPHHLTSENLSALAGLSAAIEQQLEHKWPTPPAKPHLLAIAPMNAPMTDSVPVDDDGHHPHDKQWLALSLQDMFNLQTHMLCTINMLLVELIETVDLILATICHKKARFLAQCPPRSPQNQPQSANLSFSPTPTLRKPSLHLGL